LRLVDDIKRKYFSRTEVPGFLFRRVKALLDFTPIENGGNDRLTRMSMVEAARNDRLTVADLMIQSQGGAAYKYLSTSDPIEESTTHVVMDELHPENIWAITRAFTGRPQPRVVTVKWIVDCLENRSMLDERLYEPRAKCTNLVKIS